MRTLYDFHGGIHPPENKLPSTTSPIATLPLAPLLHVSMAQHTGNPARPCVAPGDRVERGTLIGRPDGTLSAAVHAPASGTVVSVGPVVQPHPSGLCELTVTLETDGQDRRAAPTPLTDWASRSEDEVRAFLASMGVVGQGGGVFPSHLKLNARALETLVVNGAECEPYITCDDRLMRERAGRIVEGALIAGTLTGAREIVVGIEDNKPEALAAMQAAARGTRMEVVAIPTKYPSGGAKQLIRILTGKKIPHGVRSTAMGVQCFNVGTLYSLAQAVLEGEPVVSRIVTLTGSVARPLNAEVPLGTPVDWLMQAVGRSADSDGVLMGGPMMGSRLPALEAGIVKATNCLIATSPALFPPPPPSMPCIRCGDCANACPAELQPMDLYWFARARQFDKARAWQLFDCIECGACNSVCPSAIPLVDYYRFAKSEIWAEEREKQAADRARARHEQRLARIEHEKALKAERLAQKSAAAKAVAEAVATSTTDPGKPPASVPVDSAKKAAIEAAMARAAARKAEAAQTQSGVSAEASANPLPPATPVTAMDPAKKAAIEAAMARAAARKAEAAQTQSGVSAEASANPATPVTAMDPAKKAAIEAAMARAAARRAATEQKEPR